MSPGLTVLKVRSSFPLLFSFFFHLPGEPLTRDSSASAFKYKCWEGRCGPPGLDSVLAVFIRPAPQISITEVLNS